MSVICPLACSCDRLILSAIQAFTHMKKALALTEAVVTFSRVCCVVPVLCCISTELNLKVLSPKGPDLYVAGQRISPSSSFVEVKDLHLGVKHVLHEDI